MSYNTKKVFDRHELGIPVRDIYDVLEDISNDTIIRIYIPKENGDEWEEEIKPLHTKLIEAGAKHGETILLDVTW
jgi:hypothetical protein